MNENKEKYNMLLRNLDISEGMCNGTRLIVTKLCYNFIKASKITEEKSGKETYICRVTVDSSKGQLQCTVQRHQFPLPPALYSIPTICSRKSKPWNLLVST